MEILQVNDLKELHGYKWSYRDKNYKLNYTVENDRYHVIEINGDDDFYDTDVLNDFNNINQKLLFIQEYGLAINVNEEYLKLKNKLDQFKRNIKKQIKHYSESKEKTYLYDMHECYEFEVKEYCLREALALLNK